MRCFFPVNTNPSKIALDRPLQKRFRVLDWPINRDPKLWEGQTATIVVMFVVDLCWWWSTILSVLFLP